MEKYLPPDQEDNCCFSSENLGSPRDKIMAEAEGAMEEWEHIESPDDLQQLHLSPPPSTTSPLAGATVIRDNYLRISDDPALFPPSDHEGLDLDDPSGKPIPPPPSSPLSSTSSSSEAALSELTGASARWITPGDGIDRRSGVRGIVWRAWDRLWFGVSVWKLASTAGVAGVVAAAAFVYVVMRRRRLQRRVAVREEHRNRLILLIKEKDQVINGHDCFSHVSVKITLRG